MGELSQSHSVVHQHTVTWIIPNFSKVVEETIDEGACNPSLESAVIKFPSSKCEWKLSLYAKHASNVNYTAFSLSREKIDPKIILVNTIISVVDMYGNIIGSSANKNWLQIITSTLLTKNDTFLPGDTLTVKCDFVIQRQYTESDFDSESKRNWLTLTIGTLTSKINKFAALYDNPIWSDVTLRCGDGSEFPAHRAILAAHSPVFSKMFQHDMLENQTNVVNILDIQAPVVRELLHHIYGKCRDNLPPGIYLELYEAADKYQLLELKRECGLRMVENLNSETVCGVAVLGDVHDDNDLFSAAKMFVQKNALKSHLLISDTWIDFVKKSPDIATRLITF